MRINDYAQEFAIKLICTKPLFITHNLRTVTVTNGRYSIMAAVRYVRKLNIALASVQERRCVDVTNILINERTLQYCDTDSYLNPEYFL